MTKNKTEILVQIREEGTELPEFATNGAACADVRAMKILAAYTGSKGTKDARISRLNELFKERGFVDIRPGERMLFGTGLAFALPEDKEIQVRNRSGLPLKRGLILSNGLGTLDSDYRGELGAALLNTTPYLARVEYKERIAQICIKTVENNFTFIVKDELPETERGEGGYGSTGTK